MMDFKKYRFWVPIVAILLATTTFADSEQESRKPWEKSTIAREVEQNGFSIVCGSWDAYRRANIFDKAKEHLYALTKDLNPKKYKVSQPTITRTALALERDTLHFVDICVLVTPRQQ